MNEEHSFPLPAELERILAHTKGLEHAYLVGGCVRDWLLRLPVTDYDIEVFGIEFDQLASALTRWGKPDVVGRSFGVVKLFTPSSAVFDFTIPRRDSKTAPGHKGFEVRLQPDIAPSEAAARRDYTINSMMYNPKTGQLLDFFGGAHDLNQRILRHTSNAFIEDPLRVLRGMQLAGRFNLQPAPETALLAAQMKSGYSELALERIRDEWFKWATLSTVPSAGLRFLEATEWIEHYPELNSLRQTPQDPQWHPEGNVFIHTCHCVDAMTSTPGWIQADPDLRAVLMFAILSHDFGKPSTTLSTLKNGQTRVISPGHDEAGRPLADAFLTRISAPLHLKNRVLPLVANHLIHLQPLTDRGVRRLAKRLEPASIDQLCWVITADHMGRPPRPPAPPESLAQLRARASLLQVNREPPRPILMGRHLLELGFVPGKEMGEILRAAYEAQLEGAFETLKDALHWLQTRKHDIRTDP